MYTAQSLQNVEQNKQSLINVSKYRMNLVITELTRILQNVDSMVMEDLNEFFLIKLIYLACLW